MAETLTPDQKAAEKAADRHRKEVEAGLMSALMFLRTRVTLAVWWMPDTWNEFADRATSAIDPAFAAHDQAAKSVWLGFDSLDPATLEAERRYREKWIQEFGNSSRRAVEKALSWGQVNGLSDADMERVLTAISGMNGNQAGSVMANWLMMQESGASPGLMHKMLADAADKALRDRVKTVAGDVLWTAVQMGQMAAGKQQQRATNASVTKKWVTAGDEIVCPVCGSLDGKSAQIGESFPGGLMMPPAHSNCRCHTDIEVSE